MTALGEDSMLTRHKPICNRLAACWLPALALAAAVFLAAAAPALADRVTLKSGETLSGTVVEEDATKIVLKTMSGTMNIPRDSIKTVEKASPTTPTPTTPGTETKPATAAPAVPAVVVIPVEPANAAKALADAKTALVAGEWVKAAGLLEGLMLLDDKAFAAEDRMGATGALTTCYLQIKDAQGAAKALSRRAQMATDANDKRRLVATAEALRTIGSVDIGGKPIGRYEEVVEAAMNWKAGEFVEDAKAMAAKAQRLNEMPQIERTLATCFKKLDDADVFVPGFGAKNRREPIAVLVANILNAAKQTIEYCEKDRPELARTRFTGLGSKVKAKIWNDHATIYLTKRQVTEEALKNIKSFTQKYEVPDLYTSNAAAITEMTEQLSDLQYYPKDTNPYPYGSYYGYGYGYARTGERIKIALMRF